MRRLIFAMAASLVLLFILTTAPGVAAATTTPSITVSPSAGIVGSRISLRGQGFPASTELSLKWATADASWIVADNPPRVTGVNATPVENTLGSVETSALGSFSLNITVPVDYGGQHVIQAYLPNGTAITGRAIFDVEPSFSISPTSGPAGTPILVTARGLGYGLYSTNYFLYWDNLQVGYFTAINSKGATSFTFYASGTPGTHYLEIFQGYPGPGYLNPWNSPASLESQSEFGSYIPFHEEFMITGDPSTNSGATTVLALVILAAALMAAGLSVYVARASPERRSRFTRSLAAVLVIVAIVVAGAGAYLALAPSSMPAPSYTPTSAVVRPTITVPESEVTSGPRITVSPNIASVGQNITVSGAGFQPGSSIPLTYTERVGDNILGYKLVSKPLKNVTAGSDGTFSFTMPAPLSLGGIHYVAAGDLTEHSNATLYIQRTASINSTKGPEGSTVKVTLEGVGWDFNTNMATLDYDNSYIGYACGFASLGNVTFLLTVSGAPGWHTIDVYPSIWWGPSNQGQQLAVEYRFSLLTPQDHPELIPSFHFSYYITGTNNTSQSSGAIGAGALGSSMVFATLIGATGVALSFSVRSLATNNSRPRNIWKLRR